MERLLSCWLINHWTFGKLCHGLSLLVNRSLIALALKHTILTFIILNSRDLSIAWLDCLWAPIAFRRFRSNYFTGAFCRIVSLFHDIRLWNVVTFVLLILHSVLFIDVLSEGLIMRDCSFAIKEQTAVRVHKFALIHRTDPFRCFYRLLRSWANRRRNHIVDQTFLPVLLFDWFNLISKLRLLDIGVQEFCRLSWLGTCVGIIGLIGT